MLSPKKAFTLAEVLITLGIIGIVAAMTIPTLMTKYQERTNVINWRKNYATLANAVRAMQEAEDPMQSYPTQDEYEYALAQKLSQYIKTGSICKSREFVSGGCSPNNYPVYALDGRKMYNDLSQWGGGASCMSILSGGLMCFDVYIVLIDVNGYSRPNTWGKDIFFALIDFDKFEVRPAKGYKTGWGPADDVKVKMDRGNGKCDKTVNDNGAGCSYYYMHNMP